MPLRLWLWKGRVLLALWITWLALVILEVL